MKKIWLMAAAAAMLASTFSISTAGAADFPVYKPQTAQTDVHYTQHGGSWWGLFNFAHLAFPEITKTMFMKTVVFDKTLFFKAKDLYGWKQVKYLTHKGWEVVDVDFYKKGYGYHKKTYAKVELEKSKTTKHTSKKVDYKEAALTAVACTLGNTIAGMSVNSQTNQALWSLGCFAGGFFNPAGGVIGGAALLALFSDQGIVTKTFRPGGWQCQEADRGRVDGCAQWLDSQRSMPTSAKG